MERVIGIPGTASIRLFHGTPWNTSEHLYPGFNPGALPEVFARTSEAVLISGHCHIPWQERQNGRLAFNPGAVFFADNGDPGAQYAILAWEDDYWKVEYYSVSYDHALARADYLNSGLLDEGGAFARACLGSLETGRNLVVELLTYAANISKKAGYEDLDYIPDEIWDRAVESFDWERKTA
jgi:hypothetical protein